MLTEGAFEIRGVTLNLRRGGSGGGAPLLYLHGAQGFGGSAPALALLAQRFAVLAPDHPGFGASDAPLWLEDVEDLAFFYLDMLEKIGPAHLVGHSLGGWIALEMAVRSTRQIRSLTLAAAAGIRVKGSPRADMFIATPEELARLLFTGDGWRAFAEAQAADPDTLDKNRIAAARYCWQPRLFDPRLEKWLHRIDRPTRILWGEADRVIPPVYGERLAALIPGATLARAPNAGHMLQAEAPQWFADEICGFIASGVKGG
jgi:pimeloyl-ACP methyl ester carboxylesterase